MPFVAARDSRLRLSLPTRRSRRSFPALAGAVLAFVLWAGAAGAQDSTATATAPVAPEAPQGIKVADVPNDKGEAVTLSWTASSDEKTHPERVLQYRILRGEAANGPFVAIDSAAAGTTSKNDEHVKAGKD